MTYRTYCQIEKRFSYRALPGVLPRAGVLAIQRLAQTREVRIESHEPGRALEERFATSLIANPVERALSITRCQAAVTC